MRYARIALLSAAATYLVPLATPAIAELGHPSGCASCEPVEVAGPTQGYDYEAGSVIGPLLSIGVPRGASALAPDTAPQTPARQRMPYDGPGCDLSSRTPHCVPIGSAREPI